MNPVGTKRKLAAILSADAVGYSRLMAGDEEATAQTLKAHRAAIAALIGQHAGRVVDAVGDNLLAEFPSVVDAVASAVDIQGELAGRNAKLPPERRMPFRIGINLGDVMVEDDRIIGDGVNIAARVEGLAEPGGIAISGTTFDHVGGKLALEFEDLGEQTVKNIPKPVRVYRVVANTRDAASAVGDESLADAAKLTVPGFAGRPAIAVLAFDNLSNDPEQEYFVDGITEDLITRLSAFRLFPVIARNSSFVYKGKSVDVKQISRELGVHYLVEGSVRKAGQRVRITAQLIDATTGHHVWAERYDREFQDIFALQDEITESIAAALEPALGRSERSRAIRQDPKNMRAWDVAQRGMHHLYQYTKEDNLEAQSSFKRAIEMDPYLSGALAGLAWSHYHELAYQWAESPPQTLAALYQAAQKAVAADEEDPRGHVALGLAYFFVGQIEECVQAGERAIGLNPSLADPYMVLGSALGLLGRFDEGIGSIEKAIRLSPRDPMMPHYLFNLGVVNLVADRYEAAVPWLEKSLRLRPGNPATYRVLAASYGHLGRHEEARAALDEMYRLSPGFTVEAIQAFLPPAVLERLLEGWRKAGWKEE